jgi:hypothetical protein
MTVKVGKVKGLSLKSLCSTQFFSLVGSLGTKWQKKTVKQAVSEARDQMYDGLYQRLGTKKGEKDIYRMTKSRERRRDIIQVKCIKDETERLLTKDEDIKNRWWKYFDKLFNKDSGSSSIELDISSDDLNRQFVRRF